MSELQQKAVQMISGLSDDNISFLIEIINRLMPPNEEANTVTMPTVKEDRKMQAYKRLDAARAEISQCLPDDFDPERELEEARAERYGSIGFDTNVVIDFLATREPSYKASSEVIMKCASEEIERHIAIHSIPNLWYVLRRTSEEKRRKWLLDICEFLRVEGVSHEDVVKAIGMTDFKDFEDCLQDRCAEGIGADYIITRNVKDFDGSTVPAVSPEEFLEVASDKSAGDNPVTKQ